MKKTWILILGVVILAACTKESKKPREDTLKNSEAPLPKVIGGTLERLDNFSSKHVSARNVDIWLPKGYSDSIEYAVLYMSDGQMLYDATTTWNKQAWNVDDVATKLFETNEIKPFIVVGVWNGGDTRHSDYFPQKPFESLSEIEKDTVLAQLENAGKTKGTFEANSDQYLKFLVNELKPFIDKNYSVSTQREDTYIMGSSMGGLISMYAISEYPEVFGGAACLSTHWVGTFTLENNPVPEAFLAYLAAYLPEPENHKIYFDTGDETLDALYPEIQKKVDSIMVSKGYTAQNWMTKYFPGENHSEEAWSKRLSFPLEFLLRKK